MERKRKTRKKRGKKEELQHSIRNTVTLSPLYSQPSYCNSIQLWQMSLCTVPYLMLPKLWRLGRGKQCAKIHLALRCHKKRDAKKRSRGCWEEKGCEKKDLEEKGCQKKDQGDAEKKRSRGCRIHVCRTKDRMDTCRVKKGETPKRSGCFTTG